MNLNQKLIYARSKIDYLKKEARSYKYNYVKTVQIFMVARALFDELQLLIYPEVTEHQFITDQTKNSRGDILYNRVFDGKGFYVVEDAESGEIKRIPWTFVAEQDDYAKAEGSALTYAERYFFLKFFLIPTDDLDPDQFNRLATQMSHDFQEVQAKAERLAKQLSKKIGEKEVNDIIKKTISTSIFNSVDMDGLTELISVFEGKIKPEKESPSSPESVDESNSGEPEIDQVVMQAQEKCRELANKLAKLIPVKDVRVLIHKHLGSADIQHCQDKDKLADLAKTLEAEIKTQSLVVAWPKLPPVGKLDKMDDKAITNLIPLELLKYERALIKGHGMSADDVAAMRQMIREGHGLSPVIEMYLNMFEGLTKYFPKVFNSADKKAFALVMDNNTITPEQKFQEIWATFLANRLEQIK